MSGSVRRRGRRNGTLRVDWSPWSTVQPGTVGRGSYAEAGRRVCATRVTHTQHTHNRTARVSGAGIVREVTDGGRRRT